MPPMPKFQTRHIFSDPNFANDAFTAGLGNANLSPFKDIAEGLSAGVKLGTEISDFVRDIGPIGQERRRLEAEIQKLDAQIKQSQALTGASNTRVTLATENERILQAQAESDSATITAQVNAESLKDFQRVMSDINQLRGDPASLIRYLQNTSNFGTAIASEKFKPTIGTMVGSTMLVASPAEQEQLYKALTAVSPSTAKSVLQTLPPDIQDQFLTIEQRDKLANSQETRLLNRARRRKLDREENTDTPAEFRDLSPSQVTQATDSLKTIQRFVDDGFKITIKEDGTVMGKKGFSPPKELLRLETGDAKERQVASAVTKRMQRAREEGILPEAGLTATTNQQAAQQASQQGVPSPPHFSGNSTSTVLRKLDAAGSTYLTEARRIFGGSLSDPQDDAQYAKWVQIGETVGSSGKELSRIEQSQIKKDVDRMLDGIEVDNATRQAKYKQAIDFANRIAKRTIIKNKNKESAREKSKITQTLAEIRANPSLYKERKREERRRVVEEVSSRPLRTSIAPSIESEFAK